MKGNEQYAPVHLKGWNKFKVDLEMPGRGKI